MSIMRMRNGISIHALREEGDEPIDHCTHAAGISIHALREEGDQRAHHARVRGRDFYPRPPRGGRRDSPAHVAAA